MPFWLLLLVAIIVFYIMPSNVATFEVTPSEFLEEYNSNVSADLEVMHLPVGIFTSVDENNQYGNFNKYTMSCSRDSRSNKLTELEICYNYDREPNQKPTNEGLHKMEEVCLAAINVVDDSWFTRGKGILESVGFYSNQGGEQTYSKNGIKYLMYKNNRVVILKMSPEKE